MRPTRGEPKPVMSIQTSRASSKPKVPAVIPKIGNLSSSGGVFGKMQRGQGSFFGIMVIICPYEWTPA